MSHGRAHRWVPVGLMTVAAFSWGAATVMSKITLEQLSPLDLLGLELAVGTAAIWAALLVRGRPHLPVGWRSFAMLGALEPALSFALFDFGIERTGAADGAILLASDSVFTLLLARAVLGERFGRRIGAGIALGFVGSVAVALGDTGQSASLLGDGLVLAASAAAAAYGVSARRVATGGQGDALSITAVQLLAATVLAIPIVVAVAFTHRSHLGRADDAHLLAALATGVLGSAIPFLLYNRAIRDMEATSAALFSNFVPVFGVALALALLGEHPTFVRLGGSVLVLLAATAAQRVGTEDTSAPISRPGGAAHQAMASDNRGADPNRVCASPTVTKPTAS